MRRKWYGPKQALKIFNYQIESGCDIDINTYSMVLQFLDALYNDFFKLVKLGYTCLPIRGVLAGDNSISQKHSKYE